MLIWTAKASPHAIFGLKKKKVKVLGLGVFDGLHRGHQLIGQNADALLTFYPHPDVFLKKDHSLKMLSTLREQRYHYPNLLVLRFNEQIAQMSPVVFLEEIIAKLIKPASIVVGEDFKFGYRQQGHIDFLQSWAVQNKVGVKIIPLLCCQRSVISSTSIRALILAGQMAEAVELLGHPFLVIGQVVAGDGRGRQLGFPTANLRLPLDKLIPAFGVYQAEVEYLGERRPALVYIGRRPTFRGRTCSFEVHIPNFEANLYRKQLKVFLKARLRGETCFSDSTALVRQIHLDLQQLGKG